MGVSVQVWFDGSSRGNPGKGTARWLIIVNGIKRRGMRKLGEHVSNNHAEYSGLIGALKDLNYMLDEKRIVQPDITIRGDSRLVVNQILGIWRLRNHALAPLWMHAKSLLEVLSRKAGKEVKLEWIPCRMNLVDPHK